jgi:ABC-type uncharacterized transport system permease subunit
MIPAAMHPAPLHTLAALLSLVPLGLAALTRRRRDAVFWSALIAAIAGPASLAAAQLSAGWVTGFTTALWLSIAASLILFALLAALRREAWRLAVLLSPYLLLLGIVGTAAAFGREPALPALLPRAWLDLHIAVSLATYGLSTLAAIAGMAVLLQERALKRKRPPGALARALPAMIEAERLQVGLLAASEAVLGLGLLTGMATAWVATRVLLPIDHKTVFSLAAFVTIGVLLWVHHRTGLGGRRAARWVLAAYLLLTLAYPGVKFVTDVLMG